MGATQNDVLQQTSLQRRGGSVVLHCDRLLLTYFTITLADQHALLGLEGVFLLSDTLEDASRRRRRSSTSSRGLPELEDGEEGGVCACSAAGVAAAPAASRMPLRPPLLKTRSFVPERWVEGWSFVVGLFTTFQPAQV